MENCIFCKIIESQIPVKKIYEDESSMVISDLNPQAPIHYLAIPRKHFAGVHLVPPSESPLIDKLFGAISQVIKGEKLDEKGYRLVINFGEKAGQSVHHIHVHILSGREFGWPPG
jgi:Diadenosine tetraphosphate (Ap4A) hydrolase and other HIT family hydrolases